MKQIGKIGISVVAAGFILLNSPVPLAAQAAGSQTDNSKMNKGQVQTGKTADDQKNNMSDVQITADIRKAIVGDSALSTYAHNVKIVTKHGAVTLKGPVRSDEEKTSVEAKAKEVAGADKVTSKITVAPDKKGKTMKSAS